MLKHKFGIMGGTFDPIHIGHLIIAEEARVLLKLEEVIFIPTGNPPHKKISNVTDSLHRYRMTKLAIEDNPYFSISPIEIERKGTTYTIDTINKLKETFNNTEFFFIIGGDSIINIDKWKDYKQLLQNCKFIVAKRKGIPCKEIEEKIEEINRVYGKTIYEIPVPYIDISSTKIRTKVIENKSIKYYVPVSVENYIVENKLYKN